MRPLFACVLFAIHQHFTYAQQAAPESAEVLPEVVFQDGSTFRYETDFRTWSDASGNFSVSAKFDRFLQDGTVRLRRQNNEKLINVKIEILAPADRELLERIRKQIDAVLIDKKEKAAFAELTAGWEEAISARYDYLKEMHDVYADKDPTEAERQQRLLAINEKYKKLPEVTVQVVMLVKEVPKIKDFERNGATLLHRILPGVRAAKYPFFHEKHSFFNRPINPGYPETYQYQHTRREYLPLLKKQLTKKNPISVGDLVLVALSIQPSSYTGDGGFHDSEINANPLVGLKKFKLLRTSVHEYLWSYSPEEKTYSPPFEDLRKWIFIWPKHRRAKVLTTEQKALLPELDAYFERLTAKYGLEFY